MTVPTLTLNNGVEIPQLGFGVFQIEPENTATAVRQALEVGYRHFDTAQMYGNEQQVGEAIAASDVDRSEIFLTTKLNNDAHDPADAKQAFERSLKALGMDYVDLFLVHWPMPAVGDYLQTWKAMEQIYATGQSKSIGVSNFQPHHLRRLHDEATITPAVNQIEVHPYFTQDDLRAFGSEHGIVTEAWSPIAQGKVLTNPTLERIAREVGRSSAQVALRWHVQRGDVVFPKSVTQSRMADNFDIFGFELSNEQMSDISGLNRDDRTGPDPDTFNMVP